MFFNFVRKAILAVHKKELRSAARVRAVPSCRHIIAIGDAAAAPAAAEVVLSTRVPPWSR